MLISVDSYEEDFCFIQCHNWMIFNLGGLWGAAAWLVHVHLCLTFSPISCLLFLSSVQWRPVRLFIFIVLFTQASHLCFFSSLWRLKSLHICCKPVWLFLVGSIYLYIVPLQAVVVGGGSLHSSRHRSRSLWAPAWGKPVRKLYFSWKARLRADRREGWNLSR